MPIGEGSPTSVSRSTGEVPALREVILQIGMRRLPMEPFPGKRAGGGIVRRDEWSEKAELLSGLVRSFADDWKAKPGTDHSRNLAERNAFLGHGAVVASSPSLL